MIVNDIDIKKYGASVSSKWRRLVLLRLLLRLI